MKVLNEKQYGCSTSLFHGRHSDAFIYFFSYMKHAFDPDGVASPLKGGDVSYCAGGGCCGKYV